MKNEKGLVEFSDGSSFGAHAGIVGLGPNGDLATGYDDMIYDKLTPENRAELAAYMIEAWRRFGLPQ